MFTKVLIISLLGWSTIAVSEPQEKELPVGLTLRIALLSYLTQVPPSTLSIHTKVYSPSFSDDFTAAWVRKVREESEQSAADFAASVGVSVAVLEQAESAGTGLDETALEKIWGLGLLSMQEFVQLRLEMIAAVLTEEEAKTFHRYSEMLNNTMKLLTLLQLTSRSEGSVQLPAVEDLLRKMRDNYNVIIQLAAQHYPQTNEFISLENFSDELIARLAAAHTIVSKLNNHVARQFFRQKVREEAKRLEDITKE